MQAYSDPSRESDPHALPDLEIFYIHDPANRKSFSAYDRAWSDQFAPDADGDLLAEGWYYWYCLPGCMPDSDPIGPFASSDEALTDARSGLED